MLPEEIKNQIVSTIRKYLPKNQVQIILFGSRATGTNAQFSDIDIGLLSTETIPIPLKIIISEELENSDIPYKIDLVDFSTVSPDFKENVMKNVVYL